MIILGVDPGYRNLGLCIVRLRKGRDPHILETENVSLGDAHQPLNFVKLLLPRLKDLDDRYGIDAVASESPPYIMKRIKTTVGLWVVSSTIAAWAELAGIPFRHTSPLSLKRATCRILGLKWQQKKIPKKSEVKEAVTSLLGTCGKTSHENDAILAVLVLFSKMILDEQKVTH